MNFVKEKLSGSGTNQAQSTNEGGLMGKFNDAAGGGRKGEQNEGTNRYTRYVTYRKRQSIDPISQITWTRVCPLPFQIYVMSDCFVAYQASILFKSAWAEVPKTMNLPLNKRRMSRFLMPSVGSSRVLLDGISPFKTSKSHLVT